jgi:hypothetical protein
LIKAPDFQELFCFLNMLLFQFGIVKQWLHWINLKSWGENLIMHKYLLI